ncbi:unnamed protein product [Leptidea sinapis]|uniref:Uncharacterized protein n=1 Tax=Leptidea sinapis TaxID=189913 RepID=A0A5E4Q9A9_9NEOP|nr:unnamed protein product [Leptidea sinapis]
MASGKLVVLLALGNYGVARGKVKLEVSVSAGIGLIFQKHQPNSRICNSFIHQNLKRCNRPTHINELVTFITNLIISLTRASVCKFGGYKSNHLPEICTQHFPQFGVKGCGSSIDDIINNWKLKNAKQQVQVYIDNSTKGVVRVLFKVALTLADVLDLSIAIGALGNEIRYNYYRLWNFENCSSSADTRWIPRCIE